MYQKFLICSVFFFAAHGLFAQNKSETANLFNLGVPVASSEDNLKSFIEYFPLYIENAQAVALIDYNYVGLIENREQARNYVKANFNGPLFVTSELVVADERLIVLFVEDKSTDKNALQTETDNYADGFVKNGYQVYGINYIYEMETYTYYVFINPVTNQVVVEKNMFGFDVPAERLSVLANLRTVPLRAATIVTGALEKAITWMINTADDDRYGYDQAYRWGELSPNKIYFPTGAGTRWDYDCSSAVITAWEKAGVKVKSAGATYTGNMYSIFINQGFQNVTSSITLSNGSGLKRGDVLLNAGSHTAMVVNNNATGSNGVVHSSINELGTATGGNPGDQTTKEFCKRTYYNYPWTYVLRYPDPEVTNLRLVIGNEPNAPYGTLLPNPPSIPLGKDVYLGIDGNNNPASPSWLSRAESTLTSSVTSVATIAWDGTITPVGSGITEIKAVNGERVGTINLTVTGSVDIAAPTEDVIKVLNTETGIIIQFNSDAFIELYTVNGILIDRMQSVQSYSRDLDKGVYIIRVNGRIQKFVR